MLVEKKELLGVVTKKSVTVRDSLYDILYSNEYRIMNKLPANGERTKQAGNNELKSVFLVSPFRIA